MKTNRFSAQTRSNEKCKYKVSIPLHFNKELSSNELSKYHLEVSFKDKPIELKKQTSSYTIERTDDPGIYKFSVQLKKENILIEEQQIEVRIEEEIDTEIDVKDSPPVEITDSNFYEIIRDTINKTELKVGRKSVQWGYGSFPVAEDKDSEVVFKKLKAHKKDDEIVQIICKIISNEKEEGLLVWKSVTILKHFKSVAGISYIKDLAIRNYSDKNVTQYLHSECIKNLDAINSLNNRDLVESHLKYFALECITPEARSAAVSSLVKNGKRNDEPSIKFLFKIISEDSNSKTRLTALDGLAKFNIGNHQSEMEELLQDASPDIRKKTSAVLLKNPLKLNFTLLTEVFEQETDNAARKSLCDLLFKNYTDQAIPYFLKVIELEDEDYMNTILDTVKYGKDLGPLVEKLAGYQDSSAFSSALNKKIEDFLKRNQTKGQ